MIDNYRVVLCLACAWFAACATTLDSAFGNLIINGGFEAGIVGGSPIGHAELPSPWTSSSPGDLLVSYDTWENTGTSGIPPNFNSFYTGSVAPEGVRWIAGFDFEEASQLLQAPLTPGQQYKFSAFSRPINGSVGSFEIWLGTGVNTFTSHVVTLPPVNSVFDGWTFQQAKFTAPANAASTPWLLLKAYSDPNSFNATYMGIDDVRLVAVPESATAVLLLVTGAVLALCRSRSRACRPPCVQSRLAM